MPKQVQQADDGTIFDTEKECQEYERLEELLLNLISDLQSAEDNSDYSERWHFKEGFFTNMINWNRGDLIRHKEDFRRLADLLDCKLPNPRKRLG